MMMLGRVLLIVAVLACTVCASVPTAPAPIPPRYVVGDDLLTPVPSADVTASTVNISVCVTAGALLYPLAAAAWHTMNRSRTAYLPAVLFTPLLLLAPTDTTAHWDTKTMVRRWVLEGDRCDVFLGPGGSATAVAISPLVDVAWLDPLSSSSELSNKQLHPIFSRAIPTDDKSSGVALRALVALGWCDLAIIFEDDPYGRSLADGMVAAATELGAVVRMRRQIPQARSVPNIAEFTAALDAVVASNVRIVFIAGKPLGPHFQAIRENGYDTRLIFVFSEVVCSSVETEYVQLRSALCVSYSFDDPAGRPFFDWYKSRNISADTPLLETIVGPGGPQPSEAVQRAVVLYHAQLHDAANHVFGAMNAHVTDPAFANKSRIDALRQFVSHGATGRVMLDAKGDRVSASAVLLNTNGAAQVPVGHVDANGTVAISASALTILGVETPLSKLPSAMIPVDTGSSRVIPLPLTIGLIAVGVVLVALVVASSTAALVSSRGHRSHDAAPMDADAPFALVFTDVESSTALWSFAPAVMSEALDIHHAIIRSLIAKHNGYEVKTIGDSFMVAFKAPRDAVAFMVGLQVAFRAATWGEVEGELDRAYVTIAQEEAALATPVVAPRPKQLPVSPLVTVTAKSAGPRGNSPAVLQPLPDPLPAPAAAAVPPQTLPTLTDTSPRSRAQPQGQVASSPSPPSPKSASGVATAAPEAALSPNVPVDNAIALPASVPLEQEPQTALPASSMPGVSAHPSGFDLLPPPAFAVSNPHQEEQPNHNNLQPIDHHLVVVSRGQGIDAAVRGTRKPESPASPGSLGLAQDMLQGSSFEYDEDPHDDVTQQGQPRRRRRTHRSSTTSEGVAALRATFLRGLRVRTGGHYGTGTIVHDAVSRSYDYYGPVANIAARVQGAGHGGQIVVTDTLLEAAGGVGGLEAEAVSFGRRHLRSVGPVPISQITPTSFDGITFPPLRLKPAKDDATANRTVKFNDDDEKDAAAQVGDLSADGSHDEDPGPRYARGLLSALHPDERARILVTLARRWHVPLPSEAALRNDARLCEAAASKVGLRSGRTVEVAHRRRLSAVSSPSAHTATSRTVSPRLEAMAALPAAAVQGVSPTGPSWSIAAPHEGRQAKNEDGAVSRYRVDPDVFSHTNEETTE